GRSNLADTVVVRVGDKKIAALIHGDTERVPEFRGRCRPAVSAEARNSITRHGADDAGRSDLTNTVVVGVGDEEIAVLVHGDSVRKRQYCGSCRAAVSAEAICSVAFARHEANSSRGRDLPDALVNRQSNVQIPFCVSCDSSHTYLSAGCEAVVIQEVPIAAFALAADYPPPVGLLGGAGAQ